MALSIKRRFYRPQGWLSTVTIFTSPTLKIILIRRVDLKSRTVETIAGTGKQSREYFKTRTSSIGRIEFTMGSCSWLGARSTSRWLVHIRSGSWISTRMKSRLLPAPVVKRVSMAHCSKPALRNLPESPLTARTLYVADSESNIIRAIDIAGGKVKTLVGGDLFEFGDVDGSGDDVRLQHPLGLIAFGDKLLIADTYNHKIKATRSETTKPSALCSEQESPDRRMEHQPSFYEPGGLTVANDKLYVADTNNHAIRVVDLKTKQTTTLRINGLNPPAKNMQALESADWPKCRRDQSCHRNSFAPARTARCKSM